MNYFSMISILFFSFAHSGDIYPGYLKFAGKWRLENCSGGGKLTEERYGISISLTESRHNAINVYILNSKGRKDKLFFSTSPLLAQRGRFRLKDDRSGDSGIEVGLLAMKSEVKIQIRSDEKDVVRYLRSEKTQTTSCEMKRI